MDNSRVLQKKQSQKQLHLKGFLLRYLFSTPSLVRLGGSVMLATGVTLLLIYVSYTNYWTKTIFRTQTVDFNILMNLLPTKLSIHLLDGNTKELQRTLDTNYGLFGVVVTNCKTAQTKCPRQEITYLSSGRIIKTLKGGKKYQKKEGYAIHWQSKLSEENLKGQLYALLRNPPPLTSEWEYKDPRQNNVIPTGRTNSGEIIGRVYFIRNSPPPFFDELVKWLKNPFSNSSGNLLNNSIALSTLFTSFLVWLLLESFYRKLSLVEQNAVEVERESLVNLAKKYEAEKVAISAVNDKIEAENRELAAKNEALRMKTLWDGFQESFEQDFAAVLANRIEELRGFFRRLYADIDNIVHDVRKAPLLLKEEGVKEQIINGLQQHFHTLTDVGKTEVVASIVEFVSDTDDTIKSIDWVLKDLRQVANLECDKVQAQSIIHSFLEDKPPFIKTNRLDIEFASQVTTPLWILCNEWHLKSIIKNVLYNCTAALTKFQIQQLAIKQKFRGKIIISCFRDGEKACIRIEDNGTGYPEEYLDTLYQTSERVNRSGGRGRGSLIVYSYLQLHYGEVKLENIATGGGRATFSFPLTQPPLADANGENQPEEIIVSTNL